MLIDVRSGKNLREFIMNVRAKSLFLARQDDANFLVYNDVQTSFDSGCFDSVKRKLALGRVRVLERLKGRSQRLRAGHG